MSNQSLPLFKVMDNLYNLSCINTGCSPIYFYVSINEYNSIYLYIKNHYNILDNKHSTAGHELLMYNNIFILPIPTNKIKTIFALTNKFPNYTILEQEYRLI